MESRFVIIAGLGEGAGCCVLPNEAAVGEVIGEAMLRRLRGRRVLKRDARLNASDSEDPSLSDSVSTEPSLLENESGRYVGRGASEWNLTFGAGPADISLLRERGSLDTVRRVGIEPAEGA